MIKLMIVDDEPIMRRAVRTIVEKHVPEIDEIYDAVSGRSAIETATAIHPDIICMDIKMPGIDGVEATRIIKSICPDAEIIVISAFDEFKAAASFMRYGIRTYLLKPLDKIELIKALYQTIAHIRQRHDSQQEIMDMRESLSEMQDILENEIAYSYVLGDNDRLDRLNYFRNISAGNTGGVAIVVRYQNYRNDHYKSSIAVRRLYKHLKDDTPTCEGVISNIFHNCVIAFFYNDEHATDYEAWQKDCVERVLRCIEVDDALHISVGVGGYAESLIEMQSSYYQANQAAMLTGNDPLCVNYSTEAGVPMEYRYPIGDEQEIFSALERGDKDSAQRRFDLMVENMQLDPVQSGAAVYRRLMIFAAALFHFRKQHKLDDGVDAGFACAEDATTLYQWCRMVIDKTNDDLHSMKEVLSKNIVDDALLFIQENYAQQITLDDISRQVNVSSFYFTKLFKARTGKTFVEYLTDLRMEHAKEMLRSNLEMKIKDISEMVGYNDYKYFCKRFRINTGMTPANYRDQMG